MGVLYIKPQKSATLIVKKRRHILCPVTYSNQDKLLVGRRGQSICQAILKFDVSCLPYNLNTVSAQIKCYLYKNDFSDIVKTVDIHELMATSQRGLNESVVLGAPISSTNIVDENNIFIAFNVTSLIPDWLSGASENFGLLLKMRDETIDNLLGFRSKKNDNSQQWPFLEVTYLEQVNRGVGTEIMDSVENVLSHDDWNYTAVTNILLFNYSYVVINTGHNLALVYLENSADGKHWDTQSLIKTVLPGHTATLIPDYIMKYARLCYKSEVPQKSTLLNIYLQGRT